MNDPNFVRRMWHDRRFSQARQMAGASQLLLPDSAFVQRGGTMKRSDLLNNAKLAEAKWGVPAISTHAADVPHEIDLLEQSNVPHLVARYSTVGRLKDAGFWLDRTGEAPHVTVWFHPSKTIEEWLELVDHAFDAPVERKELERARTH